MVQEPLRRFLDLGWDFRWRDHLRTRYPQRGCNGHGTPTRAPGRGSLTIPNPEIFLVAPALPLFPSRLLVLKSTRRYHTSKLIHIFYTQPNVCT